MSDEAVLPNDLNSLLSPGQPSEQAPWYLAQKQAIEQEAQRAISRIHKAQQREIENNQKQARFLLAFAVAVFILVLVVGQHIILISLFIVVPLLGLGFFYQAYGGMIVQASTRKITALQLRRDVDLQHIKPTKEDVSTAFRVLEKKHNASGSTFVLRDESFLNISSIGLTLVLFDLQKVWSLPIESIDVPRVEQYTIGCVMVQSDRFTFWGLDKEIIRTAGDDTLTEIINAIVFTLVKETGKYWCIFEDEDIAKKAHELLDEFVKKC